MSNLDRLKGLLEGGESLDERRGRYGRSDAKALESKAETVWSGCGEVAGLVEKAREVFENRIREGLSREIGRYASKHLLAAQTNLGGLLKALTMLSNIS